MGAGVTLVAAPLAAVKEMTAELLQIIVPNVAICATVDIVLPFEKLSVREPPLADPLIVQAA